ncbi:Uncharacterised protein [Serratia fonticola]|nr:Uncharacterised protein [Serratia fonticola]
MNIKRKEKIIMNNFDLTITMLILLSENQH